MRSRLPEAREPTLTCCRAFAMNYVVHVTCRAGSAAGASAATVCVPESDRLLLKLPGLYSAHHGARDFLEIPTGLAGFIVTRN